MTIVKYLNPRNDVAFKRIFGTEKNKDILVHFLNDIIVSKDMKPIKEVSIIDPNLHPDIKYEKRSVVDVLCEDEDGIKYIVEMQVAKVAGFEKRAQYYAARAYTAQHDKGEAYVNLKKVFFLAITEYVMFPKKKHYKCDHWILDKDTHERDLKDFSFTFLELPKFNKKIDELKTYEDKWCYFFKHADDPDDVTELLTKSNEVMKKAYEELKAYNWTKKELVSYEAAEKVAMDLKAREQYVEHEAREKALAEGMEKGREEEKIKIAKNLISKKLDDKLISESTGLSLEKIHNLKK
ncbi:Rpn family recombination-promoting nuclease/putative transposase [Candidatus Bandiella euplotis]|uniref:PD-(D/E)XK nuclease family transposase n=1 Tax=Candidatus Bandiella euplotis TaxID=1664265 RepID=A0ABZ0UMV7_9RICK|nr:Rpn family recombination-promoting nuclease/putative transposase [Candidatus Bandiella woodruffii]WPX97449.1 PD-(D/E)XK nuclease family transposase [Candidatus Bandiella woodruffii]